MNADAPILVTGATGRLGRLVVGALRARGAAVRAFSRRPAEAAALLGPDVEVATGDFADPPALESALRGAGAALLLSPVGPTLEADQTAVIAAAVRVGLPYLVKLSGSHWTIEPPGRSWSGDTHGAIERALAGSGVTHAIVRPSAWTQVALAAALQQLVVGGSEIVTAWGDGALAFIDARDIADALAGLLSSRRPSTSPLELTGPKAFDGAAIATLAAASLGRPVRYVPLDPQTHAQRLEAAPLPPIVRRVQREFAALMRAGAAARVTDTLPTLLGRPARTVEDYVAQALAAG